MKSLKKRIFESLVWSDLMTWQFLERRRRNRGMARRSDWKVKDKWERERETLERRGRKRENGKETEDFEASGTI